MEVRRAVIESGFLSIAPPSNSFRSTPSLVEVIYLAGYQKTATTALRVDRLTVRWIDDESNGRIVLDQLLDRQRPDGAWALTVGGRELAVLEPRWLQDEDGAVYTVRDEGVVGTLTYGVAATSGVADLAYSLVPLTALDDVIRTLPFQM